MTLKGYHLPLTPTGNSSLVGTPPWHFSGEFTTVQYQADPVAVRALLPKPLELADDPAACAMFFAEYQSCSDDGRELEDPVTSQYKESGIMVPAQYQGKRFAYCAFIWTSRDFSVTRGHIQGYPKHLGEIDMTRVYTLGRATPQLEKGGRFAASLSSKGRRIATARLELARQNEAVANPFGGPAIGLRLFPRLDPASADICELVTVNNRDVSRSGVWEGDATLDFSADAPEDVAALAPVSVTRGLRYAMAFTVDGGTVLQRVELHERL